MPQIINTNIASLTAQRNLDKSQSANSTALERLSSGLRINSAKDDAAGLAISTRFETQTRGLNVAIRNAGDGISLAQTAEGALGSMTDSLQRIRELAVQSANATNSDGDRAALQAEAEQLIAEISRVGEETNFNGQKLLDGTFEGAFQVGANAGERIEFSVANMTADTLGVGETAGVSAVGTDESLGNGDLIINGSAIGASSANDDTVSYDNAAASSISKAAAINAKSDETGVKALVDKNTVGGSTMVAEAASGSITLNGVEVNVDTTNDAASSRASVVSAINAVSEQTGVMATDTEDDALGVTLTASDGRNITLDYSGDLTAANTGLAETTAGSKAQVSASLDSISPSSALNFGNTEAASVTFGLTINTGEDDAGTDALNFSAHTATSTGGGANTVAGLGAVSFTLTTETDSYDVVLDQDYSSNDIDTTDTDSKTYLDMVEDINAQISGSGVTASVNGDGKLTFSQDASGAGFIKLENGSEANTRAAFGNNDTTSIFGEAIDQDGETLDLENDAVRADGRDDSISFDVSTTNRDGEVTVNKITIDDSVRDLDGLVASINESLSAQSGSTVIAQNNEGKLSFETRDNFSGGITVGNFRDGNNQSEDVTETQNITDSDINALFGMDITTASGAPSTGSGVKGNVDLDATGASPITLSNDTSAGTKAQISIVGATMDTDAAATAGGVVKITLGDITAEIAANTLVQGADAEYDDFVDDLNTQLAASDLNGLVVADWDGTNINITAVNATDEDLTITSDADDAAAADVLAELDLIDDLFGVNLSDGAGQTIAVNDQAANTSTLSATGVAATTKNNTMTIDLTNAGISEEITIAESSDPSGSYADNDSLVTAINSAIADNTNLNGKVQAFSEDGGISIRQLDENSTDTLTATGLAATSVLGTQSTVAASTAAVDSATSTVVGDGDGEVGGADTFEGGFTLVADGDVNEINISGGDNTGNGNIAHSGIAEGSYKAGVASVTSTTKTATVNETRGTGIAGSAISEPITVINSGAQDAIQASIGGAASAFNATTTNFGGNAGADAMSFELTLAGAESGNGTVEIALTTDIQSVDALLADINDELTASGVGITAQSNSAGDGIEFVANNGGDAEITIGELNTGYNGAAVGSTTAGLSAALGMNIDPTADTASIDLAASGGTGQDLSAGAVTFDISLADFNGDEVSSASISLSGDYTQAGNGGSLADAQQALIDDLNSQLSSQGAGITVTSDGTTGFGTDKLIFTSDTTESDLVMTLDNFANTSGVSNANVDTMLGTGNAVATPGALDSDLSSANTGGGAISRTAGTDGIVSSNSLSHASTHATLGNSTTVAGENEVSINNTLSFSVDGGEVEEITLDAATYADTDALVDEINDKLGDSTNLQGATAYNEDGAVVIRSNNTANSGSISAIGGTAADDLGLDAVNGTAVDKELGVKSLEAGDLVINDVAISAAKNSYDTASFDGADTSVKSASGIAIAEAINRSSEATGVTAEVNATSVVGGDASGSTNYGSGDAGNIHINGVDLGTITLTGNQEDDRRTAVDMINDKAGQTGVSATDNGVSISLMAADGRNLSVAIDNKSASNSGSGDDKGIGFGAAIGLDASVDGIGEGDITGDDSKTTNNTYETAYSTIKLSSAGSIDIKGGLNGNDAIEKLGLETGEFGGATDGQFVKDIDISTLEGANAAISALDNALEKVASERANLGAMQNRMETTVSNLAITSENLTASNSRIRDADFATESAELSRTQVLQQAGISILAQANQRGQQVLSLLG
ncbi:flagellin [Marinicellulosiphila megalodicopiae]|uniref:flagellin N-terminal helical domain-containing protein n=1 Tax=Marinicellulosiphila megalodicopiae TaxID=2724896 RepID=UPI003BAEB12A